MENNALYYSIVPIAVYISLAGNIIGIVCVLKRKLQSIKTKFILKCLFAVDFIYLLKTLIEFAMINLEYQSIFPCKFFYYLSYFSFENVPPMILLYMSLERLISIVKPQKSYILRQNTNQFFYFIFLISFNLLYYSPFISLDMKYRNDTADYESNDSKKEIVFKSMDILNRICFPWFLLLITTIVLIFKLKCKYFFSLTMTCILLNLSHLALSLPLTLVLNSDLKFSVNNVYLSFILYNSNFGIDFYIIFFFNLKFRHELLLSNSQSNEQILLRNF